MPLAQRLIRGDNQAINIPTYESKTQRKNQKKAAENAEGKYLSFFKTEKWGSWVHIEIKRTDINKQSFRVEFQECF